MRFKTRLQIWRFKYHLWRGSRRTDRITRRYKRRISRIR